MSNPESPRDVLLSAVPPTTDAFQFEPFKAHLLEVSKGGSDVVGDSLISMLAGTMASVFLAVSAAEEAPARILSKVLESQSSVPIFGVIAKLHAEYARQVQTLILDAHSSVHDIHDFEEMNVTLRPFLSRKLLELMAASSVDFEDYFEGLRVDSAVSKMSKPIGAMADSSVLSTLSPSTTHDVVSAMTDVLKATLGPQSSGHTFRAGVGAVKELVGTLAQLDHQGRLSVYDAMDLHEILGNLEGERARLSKAVRALIKELGNQHAFWCPESMTFSDLEFSPETMHFSFVLEYEILEALSSYLNMPRENQAKLIQTALTKILSSYDERHLMLSVTPVEGEGDAGPLKMKVRFIAAS